MTTLYPMTGAARLLNDDGAPVMFTHGEGPKVFDSDGRNYLDYICGWGPVILGHGDAEFSDRLAQELSKGTCFPSQGESHHELAEAYHEHQSAELRTICYFKTSSEAVTAAVRSATITTGRMGILRCGFLGWHDALLGGSVHWHEPLASSKRETARYNDGYRGVSSTEPAPNWVDLKLDTLQRILDEHGDSLALFAIDVFQASFTDAETITAAVRMCKAKGIKILYDETKTAGRQSPVGYYRNHPEPPDYVVLGKAIGNGAPMAVLFGDEADQAVFQGAFFGGTHAKDLVGVHAATIVMELMKARDGYAKVVDAVTLIMETFNKVAARVGIDGDVRIDGLLDSTLFEVRWSNDLVNRFPVRKLLPAALQAHGVLVLDGHCSFAGISHADIDPIELESRLESGLRDWDSRRHTLGGC